MSTETNFLHNKIKNLDLALLNIVGHFFFLLDIQQSTLSEVWVHASKHDIKNCFCEEKIYY